MKPVKNIDIFYFSGTGNAKQIALWFAEFAVKKNINCKVFNIAKLGVVKHANINPNSLILIISPTHGFNFPKITLDFIYNFPKGGNRIVLMNTRGGLKLGRYVTPGLSGIAFMLSSLILKRKGYKILGQIPFDMPSNWISIHPALNENSVQYLHKKNYERVEKHANKIFSGNSDFLAHRDLVQDILISPISLAYYIVGRFVFAKSFYANANCNNCGLCVKECPVKAIKIVNNRPYWTFNCESCMKCMNSCPKQAIETAHGLLISIWIINSVLLAFLLNNLLKIEIECEFISRIISTLVFFILLWLGYKFQHILLRNRIIAKLISFASLTHYRFWGRYKSIPDNRWKR